MTVSLAGAVEDSGEMMVASVLVYLVVAQMAATEARDLHKTRSAAGPKPPPQSS